MRRFLPFAAALILALASISLAQEATPAPSPKPRPRLNKAQLLKQLSAIDMRLWEAWKNKDSKPFMAALSANSVMVDGTGVSGKQDVVKNMAAMPCDVKSYELSDWKLTMLDADAALVTYKGTADGTCGGQPIPPVWASSIFVRQGGKWKAAFHQETPVQPGQ